MRFHYVDSGLQNDIGHNANCCRAVARELTRRGIPFTIYGFARPDESLKRELGVRPHFRADLYHTNDGDPFAGWLNAFADVSMRTARDLARIEEIAPGDIVYVASAYAGQLLGVIGWLSSLAPAQAPFVIVDLLGHPGVRVQPAAKGYTIHPWAADPRAMLYRHAVRNLAKRKLPSLTLAYADRVSAQIYSTLLGIEVTTLPFPIEAANPKSRAGRRPITVSLLGNQRNAEKGYHFVPQIAAGLLQSHPDIRIRVHNSLPGNFPQAGEAMRALAANEPRVMLDERAETPSRWAELLDETDLMLCPYSVEAYQFMTSGVHSEALANAIPAVVPAGTALARTLADFGDPGVAFERFESDVIVAATRRVLDDFDAYAAKALAASAQWHATQGPAKLVDAILALVGHD